MIKTLTELRSLNKKWFLPSNIKFFGDYKYWLLSGKRSKNKYLVRKSDCWTVELQGYKEYCFRINPISVDGTIENVLDDAFKTFEKVKQFLKEK
tara:strand:- start:30 stop:311 length:282 start_codon:yes stop_codon:yes gene_type:complete